MKILIGARGFDGHARHEIGIFELDQARALRALGHDVRLAALDLRSLRHRRPLGFYRYAIEDIPVYYYSLPLRFRSAERNIRLLCRAGERALGKICAEGWRPDVIHGHFGAGFSQAAKKNGIPFVYTEHSSRTNRREIPEEELRQARELYACADKLLCVSTPLAENIYAHTGIRGSVMHNIVDTRAFAAPGAAHTPGETFRFAAVGGLIHRKGYDLLLSAASELRRRGRSFTLTIFGDGEERAALEKSAAELGIADIVVFRGNQPRNVIAEAYRNTDAFVLASRLETFGVVYIEAMAAGLPVIASVCGGPEDFVTEENGILVPTEDAAALTEAMDRMMAERGRYDSAAIARFAVEKFSPESIAAQLTAVYEELLR